MDRLSREYFDIALRRNPVLATSLRVHRYDHLLPDLSREAFLEDIRISEKFLRLFEGLDKNALTFDRRIDRDLAIHERFCPHGSSVA